MSNQHVTLDAEFRQLLLELMLVSSGTTANWNPTGGGEKSSPVPPGEARPPHDYWAGQYDRQETDEGRRAVMTSAREDLERLRGWYERPRGESPEEFLASMLRETEGWCPEDVERSAWRMTARLVRRHRTLDGRWPESGQRIDAGEAGGDVRERAVEMKAAGYSVRQASMLLGVARSTVHDWWKAAA